MKKILALTCKNDFHTQALQESINKRGFELVVLEREDYGINWLITGSQINNKSKIIIEDKNGAFSDIDIGSIWFRREFTIETTKENDSAEEIYISTQKAIHVNSLFRALSEFIPSINKPSSNWKASSKFLQQTIAVKNNLLLPNTYQGGSPDIAFNFTNNSEKKLCIKPLEGVHLKKNDGETYAHYTSLFNKRPLNELHSLRTCPVVLQSYIEKEYELRITIVGKKIFAASINTKNASDDAKIDWRHYDWANTPYHKIDIPDYLKRNLLGVMKDLKLHYGAFDLIKSTDGNYYFLEVNSQGQWLWLEDLTDLKITQSIAEWLIKNLI